MNRIGDTLMHFGPNRELVRVLIEESVEFIVVGGLAVSWYCPDRQADDMDILVNPTDENSARIFRALRNLIVCGFEENSFSRLGLQVPLKNIYYAEILTPPKQGPNYGELAKDATHAQLFEFPILVATITSLIVQKQLAIASNEEMVGKHLADIERLKQHAV